MDILELPTPDSSWPQGTESSCPLHEILASSVVRKNTSSFELSWALPGLWAGGYDMSWRPIWEGWKTGFTGLWPMPNTHLGTQIAFPIQSLLFVHGAWLYVVYKDGVLL